MCKGMDVFEAKRAELSIVIEVFVNQQNLKRTVAQSHLQAFLLIQRFHFLHNLFISLLPMTEFDVLEEMRKKYFRMLRNETR